MIGEAIYWDEVSKCPRCSVAEEFTSPALLHMELVDHGIAHVLLRKALAQRQKVEAKQGNKYKTYVALALTKVTHEALSTLAQRRPISAREHVKCERAMIGLVVYVARS